MARVQKGKFEKADVKLARYAKALAHPARVAIMRHLSAMDACCFTEISKAVPLADSTVSQHLSELKSAGLIHDIPDPPRIKYCISTDEWRTVRKLVKELTKIRSAKKEKQNSL